MNNLNSSPKDRPRPNSMSNDMETVLAKTGAELRTMDLSPEKIKAVRSEVHHLLGSRAQRGGVVHYPPIWQRLAIPIGLAAGVAVLVGLALLSIDRRPPAKRNIAGAGIRSAETEIVQLRKRLSGDMRVFEQEYTGRSEPSVFESKRRNLRGRMTVCSIELQNDLAGQHATSVEGELRVDA